MIVSKSQLEEKTKSIRDERFSEVETSVIPTLETPGLTFGNSGKYFYATVLYIDIRQSSKLLDCHYYVNVAKLLTAFYNAIVRIANEDGGEIRSFNGDSLLVFFNGTEENTKRRAICSAMRMVYAITEIINPTMTNLSDLDFGIGIDYSKVLVTKVGIGGSHTNKDLVWIGRGVNRAAKISDRCRKPSYIGISERLFTRLDDSLKYSTKGTDVWNQTTMTYNNRIENIYTTNYYIAIR